MSHSKKAQVFHFDLFGKREEKYDFLNQKSIDSIQWAELEVNEPGFFFVKKDFDLSQIYENGISVSNLFQVNNTGIETGRDEFFIDWNKKLLSEKVQKVF